MKTCVIDPQHDVPTKFIVKQGANIFICNTCECIMADIEFSHDQYESENYYTMVHRSIPEIEHKWSFRWCYVLDSIKKVIGPTSLLDVGAGNGYFVDLARREFGFDARGLEISHEEVDFAKQMFGVDLLQEDIADHQDTYNVITSFNVLEHVINPQEFLKNMLTRLNPDGILVLTTPNPTCIHVRTSGLEKWKMIDPPHHVNLFTRGALDAMLDQNGLREISYETLSTYINFVQRYDTKTLLFRKLFFHILKLLNLGADHFIIAKRK